MHRKLITLLLLILSIQLHASCASLILDIPARQDSLIVVGEARQTRLDAHQLKLLVWNIYKEKRDFLPHFLKMSQDQDLILLQEAVRDTSVEGSESLSFADDLPYYQWVYAKSFVYERREQSTGVMTGSLVNPIESFLIRSKATEPVSNTPKMALVQFYELTQGAGELLVINVHKINFVTNRAFYREVDQIMEIAQHHRGPIILAGDFNTWNKKRWSYLEGLTSKIGLQDVSFENDHRKTFFGKPLDHIFIRGFEVRKSQILEKKHASDHNPLLVELSIKS